MASARSLRARHGALTGLRHARERDGYSSRNSGWGTPDHVQRLPCRVFDAFNNCMNEQQKAGFRRLEESGYLPGLREFATTRCAPFFWSFQPDPGQPLKIRNGTIAYVRTGQRDIGITASHVYDSKPRGSRGRLRFPDAGRRLFPTTSAADSAVKDYVPEFSTPSWDSGPKNNEAS
jgi:hypothetical protein